MARDPKRIKPLLEKLEQYWTQPEHDDLRLCQIIGNFFPGDPYYVEDSALEAALDKALEK